MKTITKIITAALAVCAIASCNKISTQKISLSTSSVSFPKAGGTETVTAGMSTIELEMYESDANGARGTYATVTSTSPLTYTLDWVSVSINGDTMTVTATENTSGQKRYASVHVWDICASVQPNDFTIVQE